jgi:hypothetical protein
MPPESIQRKLRRSVSKAARAVAASRPVTAPDPVRHPPHYTFGRFEVIDVIEDWGLDFHEASVLKYLARWRRKNGVEDLEKAAWYLQRLIDRSGGEHGKNR